MEYKNTLKMFLITILMMAILNCSYADTGQYTGENQGKYAAQDYLDSHNLPYKVTTTTLMYEFKSFKTNHTKWFSEEEIDNGNKTFEGEPVEYYKGMDIAWKATVVNNQGNKVGSIWVDLYDGKIIKVNLKPVNNINSNQTINATNQTPPEPNNQSETSNNTWIILFTAAIAIALGGGYWKFNGR